MKASGKLKRFWLLATALGLLSGLLGCAAMFKGNYLVIQGKGDIALVSFALDRNFNAAGDSTIDRSPAIDALHPGMSGQWVDHQNAVNAMYAQCKQRLSAALLNAPLVDPAKIEGNAAYLALTAHETNLFLGIDAGTGVSQIPATGLNYVSPYNKGKIDSLCMLFGVNLLFLVENKAFYVATDSVRKVYKLPKGANPASAIEIKTIPYRSDELTRGLDLLGTDKHGVYSFYNASYDVKRAYGLGDRDEFLIKKIMTGCVELTAEALLAEKGKGLVWSRRYSWLRPNTQVEFDENRAMKRSDWTAQLTEASAQIYEMLTGDAKRGKEYVESQAAQAQQTTEKK